MMIINCHINGKAMTMLGIIATVGIFGLIGKKKKNQQELIERVANNEKKIDLIFEDLDKLKNREDR